LAVSQFIMSETIRAPSINIPDATETSRNTERFVGGSVEANEMEALRHLIGNAAHDLKTVRMFPIMLYIFDG
jgi:hypothetical protein